MEVFGSSGWQILMHCQYLSFPIASRQASRCSRGYTYTIWWCNWLCWILLLFWLSFLQKVTCFVLFNSFISSVVFFFSGSGAERFSKSNVTPKLKVRLSKLLSLENTVYSFCSAPIAIPLEKCGHHHGTCNYAKKGLLYFLLETTKPECINRHLGY